jgi:flagellar hook-basal body protein
MSNYGNFSNIESATRASAGNIAGSRSLSGKKTDALFASSFIGNNVGYVSMTTRTDMTQGDIASSSAATDFSFSGENGFAVVRKNPNDLRGESVFTRSCSFRQNKDGNLVNQSGYYLMGWALDNQGNPPRDNSLLESLSTVNLNRINYGSKPSTEIYISANLSAKQAKLKGAGTTFKIDRSGLNSNLKESDIIAPEKALQQGDTFTMTSNTLSRPKTFVYGGISISRKITEAPIYGASTTGAQFNVATVVTKVDQIESGKGLTITYKGQIYNLKAKNGDAHVEQYEFTSLDSLSKAIAKIDGLKSNVKDGRLLVSADDNEAVRFDNYQGSNMKEMLGLVNIAAAAPNTERFSTLEGFKKKINENHEVYGLEANSVTNGLDIHSRVATAGFTMTGSSLGVTRFERATIGNGTERDRATVKIDSPKHELKPGDFVKISAGIHVQAPEGIYMVNTTPNSDQFTISLINDAPGNFPVVDAAAQLAVPPNATWQKVAGEKFASVPLAAGDVTDANPGADAIEITAAGNTLANNDVIYISGMGKFRNNGRDITVPDGYYIVHDHGGGNTFQITATANAAAGPLDPGALGNFSYQKVGATAGAGFVAAGANVIGNFNTQVMQTFAEVHGVAPARIKLNIPNNNYAVRDYFSMNNLPADGLVIDHIRIKNDVKYQIIERGVDWIEFTTTDPDMNVGGNVVGGRSFAYGAPAAPLIPIDFRINHYNKTCDYLGMQQNKEDFTPTYASEDELLSLSSGKHAVDRIYSAPTTIIDSLGVEHTLMINFAKLDNNRWAVEVQAQKNDAGGFDVIAARRDGFIKAGILEFNNNGSFATSGGLDNINVTWNNGSDISSININWEQIADNLQGQSSRGISQQGDYNDVITDGNGHKSGNLTGVEIDQSGYIIGSFSNGQTKKLYKIPVATFDNINGLQAGLDGTYRATRDSGAYRLKFAGENGVPNIQSKSIEGTNADITAALLDLSDLSQYSNAIFSAERMEREATEKAVNNLTR